ncbi:MAG: hypothetical protein JO306_01260 [Gemmatimonadetes bacterium]|nr:hypothetical protein [Gemmatimonadota bacterium]
MSRLRLLHAGLLLLFSACAPAMRAAPGAVRIVVHNPELDPLMARACGPAGCSDFRRLDGRARTTFVLDGAGGTRAVVEGKRGDRFVARHPVDFAPGETYHVEMSLNL